ncbi:MAG: hypothetical protein OXF08_06640 [Bacteroidetes bacterium]|nr:hypothetical protein [Bacteroidota bacterium]
MPPAHLGRHETSMDAKPVCKIFKKKASSDGLARASLDKSKIGGPTHRFTRNDQGSCGAARGVASYGLMSWPVFLPALICGVSSGGS